MSCPTLNKDHLIDLIWNAILTQTPGDCDRVTTDCIKVVHRLITKFITYF